MSVPEEPSPDGHDVRGIEELTGLARAGNKAAVDGLVSLAQAGNKAALYSLVGLAQAASKAAYEGLVKLAQAGNQEACSFLFEQYNDRVFSSLWHILHNWEDAKELTQETFLKAFVNLPKLRDPAQFKGWLFQIAYHLAMDHFRRKRHQDELLFSDLERSVSSEPFESEDPIAIRYPDARSPDFSDSIAERDFIISVLAKVPIKQRNCFLLKEVAELSLSEIAEILEIGRPTVITYLSLVRKFLKENYRSYRE
jgi:RNA polymerase sigma-70 factor (ECF subfamily)